MILSKKKAIEATSETAGKPLKLRQPLAVLLAASFGTNIIFTTFSISSSLAFWKVVWQK
jgi:hypothetical protein